MLTIVFDDARMVQTDLPIRHVPEDQKQAVERMIKEVLENLTPVLKQGNDLLKSYTKNAREAGEFSHENRLLHDFVSGYHAVRGALKDGRVNLTYIFSWEGAKLNKEIEEQNPEIFERMGLSLMPSELFDKIRAGLEPFIIKKPLDKPRGIGFHYD